ncbi:acyltransferase family protein [Martelella endophytica]|uniref:Acyltransferase 3 domain-containing protein n=1 Tax=Martelella endophytica TaxID=1486262 RepID=A0A0D5LSQ0_MAREN|nr:acyltransferase [Martelella endophytica]AJY46975.1 hypothetical protein TM49_16850 [Martelella endophytica]
MRDRLRELDGLRGVAILIVIFYHYLGRFPDFYPYGFNVSNVFEYGKLGVHLFFIISGFVISLTLERSAVAVEFVSKRLGRLLPPMIACSLLTFAVMWSVDTPFTQFRRVGWEGFFPSWTFTRPLLWHPIFPNADYIDGAYWSLFVEVRFYFWAAVFAFMPYFRKFTLVTNMMFMFFVAYALRIIFLLLGWRYAYFANNMLFFTDHLYLFISGVLFYNIFQGRNLISNSIMVCVVYSALFLTGNDFYSCLVVTSFYFIFILLVFNRPLVGFLCFRPLVFVGAVSYSTYLLHQNIGVTILTSLPAGWSAAGYLLMIAGTIALVLFLGWMSFNFIERKSYWYANILASLFARLPRAKEG